MTTNTLDFDALCREHRAELLRYALKFTHSRPDAEDAVQEAFLVALAKRCEWTDQGRPAVAWLMTITKFKALSQVQARGRAPIPSGEIVDRIEDTGSVEDVDGPCLADEGVAETVAAALDRLPRRQREALRLRYLGGNGWRATAEAMGIRITSAENLAYAGLRRLQQMAVAA